MGFMNRKLKIAASLLCLTAVSGCGGNDPLNVFGRGDAPPAISLPLTGTLTDFSPYVPAQKFFTFRTSGSVVSVTSPTEGLITAIDIEVPLGVALYSVTILHNTRYTVIVGKMSGTVRRVGDYVTEGSPIGTSDTATNTSLSVIQAGQVTCPYSFINVESRHRINTRMQTQGGNIVPCDE